MGCVVAEGSLLILKPGEVAIWVIVKLEWVRRYDQLPERQSSADIIQSWDTACKEGGQNDYSVCSTWLHRDHNYYLVDVVRGRFDYPSLKQLSISHSELHKPGTILVEDSGVGTALAKELRDVGRPAIAVKPQGSKLTRMSVQCGKFAERPECARLFRRPLGLDVGTVGQLLSRE